MFHAAGTGIANDVLLNGGARGEPMRRRVRDLIATTIVVLVLFGMLASMNPRMREGVDRFTSEGVSGPQWSSVRQAFDATVLSAMAALSGFAADNIYLFSFLVVAFVLLVLMVRS